MTKAHPVTAKDKTIFLLRFLKIMTGFFCEPEGDQALRPYENLKLNALCRNYCPLQNLN